MTGQAEIRRREGKGVDCHMGDGVGMGRRKNFQVEETVSLPRPWAGKGPEQGLGGCQAGNKRKSGLSEAGGVGHGQDRVARIRLVEDLEIHPKSKGVLLQGLTPQSDGRACILQRSHRLQRGEEMRGR